MSIIKNFPHILHGGDYNPDQWRDRPGTVDADFALMDQANCNAFSVGIFSWGQLEPVEGTFDFGWLDDIMDRCAAAGKKVFLATPTGGRPGWLGCDYPETNRVDASGRRAKWHYRHNHCWSSPAMREKTAVIDAKLAERYAGHPALGGWHISNEYNGECFCELCLAGFHAFLQQRYKTLEALNAAYWSGFWSHTFTAWHQVDPTDLSMDTARLDWRRFTSRQVADFLKFEIDCVRRHSQAPVTTNQMGFFTPLDYWRIVEHCDFISDDSYPAWTQGSEEEVMADFAMHHDMHYTMLGKPFAMLESCPGTANWMSLFRMRRPGEFEREMLLAIGHGADATMYFQWRKGLGNCEKFHGAVVGPDGTSETRVFREVAAYGAKLKGLDGVVDSKIKADVAVIFDWESNWALDISHAFGCANGKRILETIVDHYRGIWRHNVSVAVIESTCDFSPYKVVVAPMLFMFKPGVAERLERFAEAGGAVVATYLSGYVDEANRCFPGGFPGGPATRRLFGIWNEDIDCPEAGYERNIRFDGLGEFAVADMAEYLHCEGAETMASYSDDFFAAVPAVTLNRFGAGKAWYVGCRTGIDFLTAFYGRVLAEAGVVPVLPELPGTLRASKRSAPGGRDYYFICNLSAGRREYRLPRPMRDIWDSGKITEVAVIPGRGAIVLEDGRP